MGVWKQILDRLAVAAKKLTTRRIRLLATGRISRRLNQSRPVRRIMPSNFRSRGMIALSHSSRIACASLGFPTGRSERSITISACGLPLSTRRNALAAASPQARINLNSGVFNPELLVPHPSPTVSSIGSRARLRDRCDAVIAHEYHEGQGVSHSEAEHRAAETELTRTPLTPTRARGPSNR